MFTKKNVTLISFSLFAMGIFAQHSTFTVFSDNAEKFFLYVNGKKINDVSQSRVADVKFSTEFANLKIEFDGLNIQPIKKNVALKDMDGNYLKSVLIIKQNNKGKYKFRVNSFEAYYPEEEPNTEVVESGGEKQESNENGSTTVKEESTTNNTNSVISISANDDRTKTSNGASFSVNINAPDDNEANISFEVSTSKESTINDNVNISMNVSETSTTVESNVTNATTNYNESTSSKGNGKSERCAYAVTSADFARVKINISSLNFEDSKLTTAKDIAKNKCLTSIHIHDIMKLFDFESSRLDFSKFAYKYAYDKENYCEVYNAFDMELSIDELKEAID